MKNHQKSRIASWSGVLPSQTYLLEDNIVDTALVQQLDQPFIPRGSGRSFGDAAYVSDGITLSSKAYKKIYKFDRQHGSIQCEAGVHMVELHNFLESSNWSFPVYGGTQWVSIGGAVACDIHGKNDHIVGSFGNHIESITLITPTGSIQHCSVHSNSELFKATIGGLGLTGFILSVKLRLQKKRTKTLCVKTKFITSFKEMLLYFQTLPGDFKFGSWVTWPNSVENGIFYYANPVKGKSIIRRKSYDIPIPIISVYNSFTFQLATIVKKYLHTQKDKLMHIQDFNYIGPHEWFKNWNSFFGKKGIIEYQFIVPEKQVLRSIRELHKYCTCENLRLFNVVIKKHSAIPREGLLSFLCDGYSINFQLTNEVKNKQLLVVFTDFLLEIGGRVYMAKDSCIRADQFERMYPHIEKWRKIVKHYDPNNRVQSDLSNRLSLKPW